MEFGGLWPTGEICRSAAGNPIVVYDHLADRWPLSQFADPTYMYVAISDTSDPTAGRGSCIHLTHLTFPTTRIRRMPEWLLMSTYECNPAGITCLGRLGILRL
jgi:hypothetical protein